MDVYAFIMSPSSSARLAVAEENNTSVLEGGREWCRCQFFWVPSLFFAIEVLRNFRQPARAFHGKPDNLRISVFCFLLCLALHFVLFSIGVR
jgi:hypothetical protein